MRGTSLVADRLARDGAGQLYDLATGWDVRVCDASEATGDGRVVLDTHVTTSSDVAVALVDLPVAQRRDETPERWTRVVADLCEGDASWWCLSELRAGERDVAASRFNVLAMASQARRLGVVPVCLAGLQRLPEPGGLAGRTVAVMPSLAVSADSDGRGVRRRALVGAGVVLAALKAHVGFVVSIEPADDACSFDVAATGHDALVAESMDSWQDLQHSARRDRWLQCARGGCRRRRDVDGYLRDTVELASTRMARSQFRAVCRIAREARVWKGWWGAGVPRDQHVSDVLSLIDLEYQARIELGCHEVGRHELALAVWAASRSSAAVSLRLRATLSSGLRASHRPREALELLRGADSGIADVSVRVRLARERFWAALALSDWTSATEATATFAALRAVASPASCAVAARELATFYDVIGDTAARDTALALCGEHYGAMWHADRWRYEALARRAGRVAGHLRKRKHGGPPGASLTTAAMKQERQILDEARKRHMSALSVEAGANRTGTAAFVDDPRAMQDVLDLLQVFDREEDERLAMGQACTLLRDRLGASSVGLWTTDTPDPVAGAGTGRLWASALACRAQSSGLPLGPERGPHGVSMAWPVGHAHAIIGAIGCCWMPDTRVEAARSQLVLTAATAACAPVLRAWLDRARVDSGDPDDLGLVGGSRAMQLLRAGIRRAAGAPYHVLIEGESGSGKELVARAIHAASARRPRRFCAVNCAALTDDLLEAELFGHTRGAFTGAIAERAGLFEDASGGTLFLDEVADLSPRGQAKVLRVLQDGEVRRVGETFSRRVDTRVVAATNKPLRVEAEQGRFREDLRYRLEVLRLAVPGLRERREDIAVLAGYFWREATQRVGSRAVLDGRLLAALSGYDWPGNVRELQNVIAHLAVHAPRRGRVGPAWLPERLQAPAVTTPIVSLDEARRRFEVEYVGAVLVRAAGRRTDAARALGVTRQGLAKLVTRLGLAAPDVS
ncbi:MAG: sigma 54-interacting transcriptional regulator [Vicinamibacterales bacterium]